MELQRWLKRTYRSRKGISSFDIKQSYYTYLKALRLKELLNQTKELVEENLRVSEVLFANDKVTEDAVWRSKTEVRKVDFQIAEAEKQYQMAKRYFNQLLNRDLLEQHLCRSVFRSIIGAGL